MFNADRVNNWLFVGGDLSTGEDLGFSIEAQINALVDQGVTHILDARIEWSDEKVWAFHAPQVKYLHLPIDDDSNLVVSEDWFTAVEGFAADAYASGGTLLAHCHMGVNRGPSAALTALLHIHEDLDPEDAFRMIRSARPMSGLVYASQVGRRALRNRGESTARRQNWVRWEKAYWTPELNREVHKGIRYFRSIEGGTIVKG